MTRKTIRRTKKQRAAGLAAAETELRAAFSQILEQPGGIEKLQELAIRIILPMEERVRRDNPDHPTLALIDEWRRLGRL